MDDAVRLTALCMQRGVEIEGVEPDAEFLAKAMEAVQIEDKLETIGLAKNQLAAGPGR